ncbi:MAG: VOC family protein [Pseudomonadota bacterium]
MPNVGTANTDFSIRPDHFCIVVDDLDKAVEQYQSLGFTITKGAKASGGHNALIVFEDGIYIELMHFPKARLQRILLALTRPIGLFNLMLSGDKEILRRFLIHWTNAPSGHWVDWSFAVEPMEAAVEHVRASGFEVAKSAYVSERLNSENETARWKMQGTPNTNLPFLIEDFSGSAPRAPLNKGHSHDNGAVALKEVILGSPDPQKTLEDLSKLTNIDVDDDKVELNGVAFKCKRDSERKYAGPMELVLSSASGEVPEGRLEPLITGGAQISLIK